ncbi:MAG TPA: DNRLRE domain-containing protein [Rhodothermales bacterium]|nr:DNRLRE domain-containing protein [Rhodothermales bacterium]
MPLRYKLSLLSTVLLFCTTAPAWSQVNFLDIISSKDNTLYADAAGAKSNAKGQYMFAGMTNNGAERRAILAFDVAAVVPAGATIDSVRLTLHMSKTIAGTTPVFLHRVLADWGDGTSQASDEEGTGAQSQTDDVTWVHTFWFNEMWQNNGGDFQSPGDDTLDVGNVGFYTWGSTPEMVEIVQQWLDDPTTNYGWLLRGDESSTATTKRFDTRENSNEANRPRLRVYYALPTATEAEEVPSPLHLAQNYPNPFRQTTTIRYELAQPQPVTLTVYDVRGRLITTLVDGLQETGLHEATFDATTLPTGLYLYRLSTSSVHLHRAMLLTR